MADCTAFPVGSSTWWIAATEAAGSTNDSQNSHDHMLVEVAADMTGQSVWEGLHGQHRGCIKRGDTVEFSSTLWTLGGAYRVQWNDRFTSRGK